VQGGATPRSVARPSPWYFATSERNNLSSRPARLALHAGRPKLRRFLSRPVACRRSDARRRQDGRCAARASPKSPPTPIPPVNPISLELNRSSIATIVIDLDLAQKKDPDPLQSGQRTALQQQGPELRRSRGDGSCLLQALVGQPVKESVRWLSPLSIGRAVSLGSSWQQASRRERRSERASAPRLWTCAVATGGPLARRSSQSSVGQARSRICSARGRSCRLEQRQDE
jgi:hypothetical protein